jgi:hypothetical protein
MSMPQIAFHATAREPGPGEYRPGACNIGPAEIARRRRAGLLGVGAAVALAAVLLAVDAPAVARLLVALPLAGGAAGLLQARLRFCAGYGMAGVRNFGALGQAERVEDPAARRADRAKAWAIAVAAGAIGLAGALVLVFLPG